jgi:hypothetical protein
MSHEMMSESMQRCIDLCRRCHETCLGMFLRHCVKVGGKHVAPDHARLMMDCAIICQTAADFMTTGSHFHARVCGVCADICEACAKSCRDLAGMESCVRACSDCAASCREISASH